MLLSRFLFIILKKFYQNNVSQNSPYSNILFLLIMKVSCSLAFRLKKSRVELFPFRPVELLTEVSCVMKHTFVYQNHMATTIRSSKCIYKIQVRRGKIKFMVLVLGRRTFAQRTALFFIFNLYFSVYSLEKTILMRKTRMRNHSRAFFKYTVPRVRYVISVSSYQ